MLHMWFIYIRFKKKNPVFLQHCIQIWVKQAIYIFLFLYMMYAALNVYCPHEKVF